MILLVLSSCENRDFLVWYSSIIAPTELKPFYNVLTVVDSRGKSVCLMASFYITNLSSSPWSIPFEMDSLIYTLLTDLSLLYICLSTNNFLG